VCSLIFYNNDGAMAKTYHTDLTAQGERPGLRIENDHFNTRSCTQNQAIWTSFHLEEQTGLPAVSSYGNQAELFTGIRVFTFHRVHGHIPPTGSLNRHMHSVSGPVLTTSEQWGALRGVPEADASVRYEFYPGVPYFINTTSMRINETVQTLALRNASIVFKRELMTYAAWYDVVRDEVITFDVSNLADLTELIVDADVPLDHLLRRRSGSWIRRD
jgi:hypothetical protein